VSLQTPERIRTLQRKLYLKAKAEPAFRFYLLYDKIHRADILSHAYALARSPPARPPGGGGAWGGRDHVRDDRGVGFGGVAGGPARRPRREDVPAAAGAAGGGPRAGGRQGPP